jgi:hypothetical protein
MVRTHRQELTLGAELMPILDGSSCAIAPVSRYEGANL